LGGVVILKKRSGFDQVSGSWRLNPIDVSGCQNPKDVVKTGRWLPTHDIAQGGLEELQKRARRIGAVDLKAVAAA